MLLLRLLLFFILALGLQASLPKKSDLLQLKIPGGIAGFSKQCVYMVHRFSALRISFVGSNAVKPIKQEQKILYTNLYKGIDLSYDGAKGLKSTYTIHPHANLSTIRLRYNAKVEIDKGGNLLLTLPTKERLRVTKPIAWQMQKGTKLFKEVAFKTIDEHTVSFTLKSYDPSKPLYIDPTYQWHTFYGDGRTYARDIATDSYGHIFVLSEGKSSLTIFDKAPLHENGDAVIMQFEENGSLDWYTFYGGKSFTPLKFTVDHSGIYITGYSEHSWNVDDTAPLHAHSGNGDLDITVLKLDKNGHYQWHTFFGKATSDEAISTDDNYVYVIGTSSQTWDVNGTAPLHPYSGNYDICILKLDKNGNYQWHTFYGSNSYDYGRAITEEGNSIYITGSSSKSWDVNGTAPLHPHSTNDYDITILKLNKDGHYQWHTFYGGEGGDGGYGIQDYGNYIYITGYSARSWDVNGTAPLHSHSGYYDITILKLDKDGNYQWHTFYGSDYFEESYDLVADYTGIYVVGESEKSWDVNGNAPLHPFSGGDRDITILKLDRNGQYQWHTFYGSDEADDGDAIDIGEGFITILGWSKKSWNVGSASPLHPHTNGKNLAVFTLRYNGSYLWHTFYGIYGYKDKGSAITTDDQNHIYITGSSKDWRGPDGQEPLHPYSGDYDDVYILALDENGSYLWHTFYGSDDDSVSGYGITSDNSGIYITGNSESSWDVNGTAPLHSYNRDDIFILKLDKNGNYQWHTFYGGNDGDEGYGIAVDENGIYVTGESWEAWNVGSHAPLHPYLPYNGGYWDNHNIFVLKLDKNGNYQWHTFYGTNDHGDSGKDIVIDSNAIYIAGYSSESWDVNGTEPLHQYSGYDDMTILKLDKNGNYQWHTFYGSDSGDDIGGIAIDADSIYVSGYSTKSWDVNGTEPLHPFSGNPWMGTKNIIILKLDKNGQYKWHTFYGSENSYAYGTDITITGNDLYISADTEYATWDVNGTAPLHPYSGGDDITILKLDKDGNYQWHTFYGGKGTDKANAIALKNSNLYVTGESASPWLGDNDNQPLHRYIDDDLFVLKLRDTVNHPPVANDDNTHVLEDSTGTIDVLANDIDPDGDTLSIISVTNPNHGNAIIQGGMIHYTPNTNYNGDDTFTYTISDGNGGSATATVHVTVEPVNDTPIADDDTISTLQGTSVTIDVLANDSDVDGDTLSILNVSTPSHGSAAIQAGKVLYTPNASFIGTDSFTYTISDGHGGSATATVTVTVSHTNHPPVANDDSFTVIEEQSTILDVLANDSDPDGDTLTITHVSNPSHGTVTIVQGGAKVQYTPEAGFYGASDSFTYTITDGHGNTSTATANVTVNVQEADGDNTKEDPNDDINHDGTKDYLQKYVSTPYIGNHKIGVATTSSNALDHVQKEEKQMSVTTEDGSHITLPYGTLSFKVHVVHSGDSAQITIYYPYNPDIQGYVKQIGNVWKKVPSSVEHDQAHNQTRVTITLTDGGDFDIDGSADGVITDPGGAYAAAQTVTVPISPWAKLLLLLGFIFLVSYYKKELEA